MLGAGDMGGQSPEGFGLPDDFMSDDEPEEEGGAAWPGDDVPTKAATEAGAPPRPGRVAERSRRRWVRPEELKPGAGRGGGKPQPKKPAGGKPAAAGANNSGGVAHPVTACQDKAREKFAANPKPSAAEAKAA